MQEILRTFDLALISFVESLLSGEDINYLIADAHINNVEGSITAFPRRILVQSDRIEDARSLLQAEGLGKELLLS